MTGDSEDSTEKSGIVGRFSDQSGSADQRIPKLLASDLVKQTLGPRFEGLAERHNTSIFVVTANDVFPQAQNLLKGSENPSPSTVNAAVTDSYMSFAGQFRDLDSDISNNIRGGIFADEFRQQMMVDSLLQKEPVGKGFITDSDTYYGVLVLPPLSRPKEKLAGYELNIDTQYFRDLPGDKSDWMNWVIEHEATHISKRHLNMGKDVQVLGNEMEADNGTYDNALEEQELGNDTPMQIVETVARLRALNAVLTPVDNNHATGPAIGYDDLTAEEVIDATQSVRLKIHSAIAVKDDISIEDASRAAIDDPARAVEEMRFLMDMGAFDDNDIAERIATLGLEAADQHVKPGYKMLFASSDIDNHIERLALDRNLHIYGQSAPDVKAVYEDILSGSDSISTSSFSAHAGTTDNQHDDSPDVV